MQSSFLHWGCKQIKMAIILHVERVLSLLDQYGIATKWETSRQVSRSKFEHIITREYLQQTNKNDKFTEYRDYVCLWTS